MFCSKTLPGGAGLFRGWLGHMLGALDLTRPIVRADKAMQAETMVHIGEEGGEQLRGCTMRSFPRLYALEGQKTLSGTMSWLHHSVCVIFSQNVFVSECIWHNVIYLFQSQDQKAPLENTDGVS